MKPIADTNWEEVYGIWRDTETHNDAWREFYENRQHKTWEEFRGETIEKLNLPNLQWKFYEIQPQDIPHIHCGPYPGWEQLSNELGQTEFAHLSKAEFFKDHAKVEAIKKDLPCDTTLIAIERDNEIYLLEGHHRCVAVSQLLASGRKPDVKIRIALAVAD